MSLQEELKALNDIITRLMQQPEYANNLTAATWAAAEILYGGK